ncbi:alanine:cation symporter family protein, partial [Bacillus subtilis]|uniref:alanine:cation symporter family protein n=1 Tax=Bacillus subtilis TaxID=1423 RepID=UPI003398FDA8
MQQAVESVISVINDFFWSNLLIILLVSIGIYFTIPSRFLQFRMLKEMVLVLKEGRAGKGGGVSRFQAFCISMAARVGTGNITG